MILSIDMTGSTPIYQQIRNQIVYGMATNQLLAGDNLPTVRQLASDLNVNHMTVNKAYQLLKQEGFIEIDRRSGAKIANQVDEASPFTSHFDEEMLRLLSDAMGRGATPTQLKKKVDQLINQLIDGRKKG